MTGETFEADVLQSTRAVLADYGAERCGPSRMITPILTAIAEEHARREPPDELVPEGRTP